MKISQISLFLENKPGHLSAICRTLADAQVNIRNLSLADTQQFGIVRLIVEEVEAAVAALEKAGHIVNVRPVTAVSVADKAGGIAAILDVLAKDPSINVEYMYAFTGLHEIHEAVLIFRFDDQDKGEKLLADAGLPILTFEHLFK